MNALATPRSQGSLNSEGISYTLTIRFDKRFLKKIRYKNKKTVNVEGVRKKAKLRLACGLLGLSRASRSCGCLILLILEVKDET
jgi:hypothetical protein